MSYGLLPVSGTFSLPSFTAAQGTVIVRGVPPWPGAPGAAPMLYACPSVSGVPKFSGHNCNNNTGCFTHISQLIYTATTTAHTLMVMRPFNFTTVSSAAAVSQAVINITTDPGIYSTKYAYPTPGGTPPSQVADNAIAAGDYCAYQLADGTWVFDTVSSVSTLAITMTTSVPAATSGTGVLAGSLFYFFGISTDSDPATGMVHWRTVTVAATRNTYGDSVVGLVAGLHKGDPLIVFSGNASNAGSVDSVIGFYSPY